MFRGDRGSETGDSVKVSKNDNSGSEGSAGDKSPDNSCGDTSQNKVPVPQIIKSPTGEPKSTQSHTEVKDNREQQDLQAQQDMAFWAMLMVFAAVATVIITAIGVWLVRQTLKATLLAVEDTGKATEAMLESNKIARETGRKQVRAYIGIESITLDDGEDFNIPRFIIEIKNNGVSPANIKNLDVKIIWLGDKATPIYTFDRKIDFRCHAASPMNLPIDMESGIKKCEGVGFFVLSGLISYEDIFKDKHVEEFYFRTGGGSTLFNMELPERMSPFPLKSIIKGVQAKRKGENTEK